MVSVPLFKDLEKAPKDLLGKDYDTQNSLKIKAKACDNKITTEIGSSSTKLTCEMPPVGGATMQKFSVSTKDDLSYEMEADNMLVDGLMVKFSTAETVGKGFQGSGGDMCICLFVCTFVCCARALACVCLSVCALWCEMKPRQVSSSRGPDVWRS
jgi:hypothetical protein